MPAGSRRDLQRPIGLPKHVAPSRSRAHIHVAEPQFAVEAVPFLRIFCPQERRNHRVSFHTRTVRSVSSWCSYVIAPLDDSFRRSALVCFRPFAVTRIQSSARMTRGCRIILFDRFLILSVKRGRGVFIARARRRRANPAKHCGCCCCQRYKSREKLNPSLALLHGDLLIEIQNVQRIRDRLLLNG